MADRAKEKEKAEIHSFSFNNEHKILLDLLKKNAKMNRRSLSSELCIHLENAFKSEGIMPG